MGSPEVHDFLPKLDILAGFPNWSWTSRTSQTGLPGPNWTSRNSGLLGLPKLDFPDFRTSRTSQKLDFPATSGLPNWTSRSLGLHWLGLPNWTSWTSRTSKVDISDFLNWTSWSWTSRTDFPNWLEGQTSGHPKVLDFRTSQTDISEPDWTSRTSLQTGLPELLTLDFPDFQ